MVHSQGAIKEGLLSCYGDHVSMATMKALPISEKCVAIMGLNERSVSKLVPRHKMVTLSKH